MAAILKFLTSMLSKGGISSKRVWGSLVMLMLCWSYMWCTVHSATMVDETESFLFLAGTLLGLDTIVTPFINNKNNGNNERAAVDDSTEEQG